MAINLPSASLDVDKQGAASGDVSKLSASIDVPPPPASVDVKVPSVSGEVALPAASGEGDAIRVGVKRAQILSLLISALQADRESVPTRHPCVRVIN